VTTSRSRSTKVATTTRAKRSEFKLLSPADARELLKLNTHNRRLNERNVLMWAQEMEEGRWRSNGEAIKISENDVLLDGQNRLTALSLQHEDFRTEFLLVYGLPDEVQVTMDQGESRTLAQQLCLADIESDKTLAAALRLHCLWMTGRMFLDAKSSRKYTTTPSMVEYAKDNPDVIALLRAGRQYRNAPARESVILASYAVITAKYNGEAADAFFSALASGAGLQFGDPVLALRSRLINIVADRTRCTNQTLLGYIVTAFNNWAAGRAMTKIQRPKSGTWSQETFPEVRQPRATDVWYRRTENQAFRTGRAVG